MTDPWIIRNEFAMVEVGKDESGHDPRLLIRDTQSGEEIYLDALELEALTRLDHESLRPLLDPSGVWFVHED